MADQPISDSTEGQPSEPEVLACLGHMLAARHFHEAPQLSAFLRFIVTETLSGRGADLKGYSIATLALGRDDSFDPQTNPIVRVQAGRLRQAMADYHEQHPADAVRIILDKGVYVPRFERMPGATGAANAQSVAERDSVSIVGESVHAMAGGSIADRRGGLSKTAIASAAVILVAALAYPGWQVLQRLRQQVPITVPSTAQLENFAPSLTVEAVGRFADDRDLQAVVERTRDALARFDDIIVVHDSGVAPAASDPASRNAGRVMALRVSATEAGPGTLRFSARLVSRSDQTVLWSREFDPVAIGPLGDAARTGIVRAVATTIAQPYGVIHAMARNRLASTAVAADDPYSCTVFGFDYWRTNDARTHLSTRDCLVSRIKAYPTISSLHAQLAYLHLEEYRQGYNPLPGNPLDRALASAQQAVTLAPASARSHQALLAAHFARGERDSAWKAAGDAMALNPYDTEIWADVGARHVQSGHYEKGLTMLNEALALNPAPPTWAMTFRALALYMLGRLDESGPLAKALGASEYPPAMMAALLVARQMRDATAAKQAYAALRRVHPTVLDDPATYLRLLNFDEMTISRIVRDFSVSREWAASLP